MLPVNLDQRRGQRLQRLCAERLIVDKGTRAAVGELHAPQDNLVCSGDVVRRHERARRVAGRQLERRRHLPLLRALAHEGSVAAGAQSKRKGVEHDGFARAGLAREHR